MDDIARAKQLFLTALEEQNAGRLANAEQFYRQALDLAPGRPSLLNNLANVLLKQERFSQALDICTDLLKVAHDESKSWITRASVFAALGKTESAASDLLQALHRDPDNPALSLLLGKTLLDAGQAGQAISFLRRANAALPDDANAACQLANALLRAFQPHEAIRICEQALAFDPDNADALLNRANAFLLLARYDEALRDYEQVERLAPHSPLAWWNDSLCRLLLGDFKRGWELYSYGWATGQRGTQRPQFAAPPWDGKPVNGDLLVWGEQGIGDQILFGTMLHELEPYARKVVVAIAPRLLPLFRRSLPRLHFISGDAIDSRIPVAAQVAIGDLGGVLRDSTARFPIQRDGYLRADETRTSTLRARALKTGEHFVVGISWRSRNDHFGALKSLDLEQLAPLLALPGVSAVDLQYGDTSAERAAFRNKHGLSINHFADIDNYNDLDGLAALINACDIVVSVSNTTVHLAGALGKPTLVMLPYALGRIWYWHEKGERSPWYPSCRLLRQTAAGDWTPVIAAATAAVSAAAAGIRPE